MRLFNLGSHFRRLFTDLQKLRNERVQLARDEAIATAGASLTGLVSMAAALVWMG